MTVSRPLQQYWRYASDSELTQVLQDAQSSVSAFAEATADHGSLIQCWIRGQEVREFEHYPNDDVVDSRRGSQFYYHSHRDGDREHGHLHLFWHATASGRRRYLKPGQPRWNRTEPTHLFAISLDARGLPVAIFAVNQWVTDGHWLDAATTLACVDRFALGDLEGYESTCRWLNGFVRLYRPVVAQLLAQRDKRMSRYPDPTIALKNHRLEILSQTQIHWLNDLDALESEVARRQRVRRGTPGAPKSSLTPT